MNEEEETRLREVEDLVECLTNQCLNHRVSELSVKLDKIEAWNEVNINAASVLESAVGSLETYTEAQSNSIIALQGRLDWLEENAALIDEKLGIIGLWVAVSEDRTSKLEKHNLELEQQVAFLLDEGTKNQSRLNLLEADRALMESKINALIDMTSKVHGRTEAAHVLIVGIVKKMFPGDEAMVDEVLPKFTFLIEELGEDKP